MTGSLQEKRRIMTLKLVENFMCVSAQGETGPAKQQVQLLQNDKQPSAESGTAGNTVITHVEPVLCGSAKESSQA
jgi:hypothetical protein